MLDGSSDTTLLLHFQLFLYRCLSEKLVLIIFSSCYKFPNQRLYSAHSPWCGKKKKKKSKSIHCQFDRNLPQEIKTCRALINLADHLPSSSIPWVFWLIKMLFESNMRQFMYSKMKCFCLCVKHGNIFLVDIIYFLCKRQ